MNVMELEVTVTTLYLQDSFSAGLEWSWMKKINFNTRSLC